MSPLRSLALLAVLGAAAGGFAVFGTTGMLVAALVMLLFPPKHRSPQAS